MTTRFSIPVQFTYNGRNRSAMMGPFKHSTERDFALTVNRKAIDECSSLDTLKPVTRNLLEGWSSMQTAFQSLMIENIELRQAMAKQQCDLEAAEEIINQASVLIDSLRREQQSNGTKKRLWPFG